MKKAILVLIAGMITLPACAKRQPVPLETGTVVSQEIGAYRVGAAVAPIGTMLVGVPIMRRSDIVVIETPTARMTWSEYLSSRRGRPVVLTVNGPVQFYQDKGWFIVLDTAGKPHKFSLVHEELLTPPRASQ